MTNDEAELAALHAELAYVKAQPDARQDRVAAIKEQIALRSPETTVTDNEPATGGLEVATVEAPETAVTDKARGRRPKD